MKIKKISVCYVVFAFLYAVCSAQEKAKLHPQQDVAHFIFCKPEMHHTQACLDHIHAVYEYKLHGEDLNNVLAMHHRMFDVDWMLSWAREAQVFHANAAVRWARENPYFTIASQADIDMRPELYSFKFYPKSHDETPQNDFDCLYLFEHKRPDLISTSSIFSWYMSKKYRNYKRHVEKHHRDFGFEIAHDLAFEEALWPKKKKPDLDWFVETFPWMLKVAAAHDLESEVGFQAARTEASVLMEAFLRFCRVLAFNPELYRDLPQNKSLIHPKKVTAELLIQHDIKRKYDTGTQRVNYDVSKRFFDMLSRAEKESLLALSVVLRAKSFHESCTKITPHHEVFERYYKETLANLTNH